MQRLDILRWLDTLLTRDGWLRPWRSCQSWWVYRWRSCCAIWRRYYYGGGPAYNGPIYDSCDGYGYGPGYGYRGCPGYGAAPFVGAVINGVLGGY